MAGFTIVETNVPEPGTNTPTTTLRQVVLCCMLWLRGMDGSNQPPVVKERQNKEPLCLFLMNAEEINDPWRIE
jgi:hypothetical protein